MSCLDSLVFFCRRRVYGGRCKTSPFQRFPSRLSCRSAWQAWHLVIFSRVALGDILHSTLYTPHSTLQTLNFTLYIPHFTFHTLHSTLYTPLSTLHTLHCTLHTLHSTLHIFHLTLYTAYSTLHNSHLALYTQHSPLNIPPPSHSTLFT